MPTPDTLPGLLELGRDIWGDRRMSLVCPVRGLLRAWVDDPDAAEAMAKREGAVVVGWSADSDHRGEVTV